MWIYKRECYNKTLYEDRASLKFVLNLFKTLQSVLKTSKKLSINLWAENVPAQVSRHYTEFVV